MMRRSLRFLPLIVFLTLAVAPAALFTVTGPWPGPSAPEFRPLRPLPSGFSASMFRRVGDWFSDRIGMRWPLLWLGVETTDRVWQPRVRGSVIVGRDPWLFFADDEGTPPVLMADVRGRLRLPDETAVTIDTILRGVHASYSPCGKRAFFLLAPNKQSIYPEQLGEDRDRPTRFDALLERLSPVARAMVIDPRPALRAAKYAHAAPLYYLTDTHWNGLGTYYAYRTVVETLARENAIYAPERAAFENYELRIRPFVLGDMAVRMLYLTGRFADVAPMLLPKPPLRDATVTDTPLRMTFANPDGRGRLVMRGDSFAPALAASLARHFAEVTLLPRTAVLLAFDGADAHDADVVLIESAERFLPTIATPPLNLEKACGS